MKLASGKISRDETERFDRDNFFGHIFVSSDEGTGFNAFEINVDGRHPLKQVEEGVRMYRVEEGSGFFTINKKNFPASSGDFFLIKKGDSYEYEGKMRMFEVNILS